MAGSASRADLQLLHKALTDAFTNILKDGVKIAVTDKETGEVSMQTVTAPAAYLNTIRQFVKDNDIQAPIGKETEFGKLVGTLPFAGDDDVANRLN